MRIVCYALGGGAMAALVWIALFGSTGHLADPFAAWGGLLAVFATLRYRAYRLQALRTPHVVWSSLAGSFIAALVGRGFWRFDMADWPEEIGEAGFAGLFVSVLMAASFYFLTLRRGHMP